MTPAGLTASAKERIAWEEKAGGYAKEGFRVLAFGRREGEGDEDLEFLGLAMLWDPPRPEAAGAIRRAQEAGIRVVMVTGDHPATALAVAQEVGITASRVLTGADLESMPAEELRQAVRESNIFARVAPEHKLWLVEALKQNGEIVAMTGDGVNDAPALKRSDVGVAMGERGSDVSREVADLALMDDNFSTIVAAIEEGRNIYVNIQKFIRESLRFVLVAGCAKAAIGGVLLVAAPLLGFSLLQTRAAVFLHASIGQLFYAYPARRIAAPPQFNGALHLAVILGVGLQLLTVLFPGLRALLGLEPLTLEILTLVTTTVLLTWGAAEAYSRFALSPYSHRMRREAN